LAFSTPVEVDDSGQVIWRNIRSCCRSEDVGAALDREGIAVRAGHHCAQPILRRFGLETTVRPSLAVYNTPEDIDALVAALHKIQTQKSYRAR
jgi:cysteine desulfurase / selenocysteine lyase